MKMASKRTKGPTRPRKDPGRKIRPSAGAFRAAAARLGRINSRALRSRVPAFVDLSSSETGETIGMDEGVAKMPVPCGVR
jgi:hypothetical protein